jgi:hypothetical protein
LSSSSLLLDFCYSLSDCYFCTLTFSFLSYYYIFFIFVCTCFIKILCYSDPWFFLLKFIIYLYKLFNFYLSFLSLLCYCIFFYILLAYRYYCQVKDSIAKLSFYISNRFLQKGTILCGWLSAISSLHVAANNIIYCFYF